MSLIDQEIHPILKKYIPVADMIVSTFGRSCEVSIHDLRNFQSSLIYLKGDFPGRNLGAPVTDIMLRELKKYGDDIKDMLGLTTRTFEGKILKASITFIRDEDKKVLGCIAINFDITGILNATQVLHDLSMTNDLGGVEPKSEIYAKDIGKIFEYIIERVLVQKLQHNCN
jgi:predicted transcriptional regulator YheO